MVAWYKVPPSEISRPITELLDQVRRAIDCPASHQVDVYRLAKWPRALHLACRQCPRDVFVKNFGQDPGADAAERQRRYDIEKSNFETLQQNGLRRGSLRNGSFSIPLLLGSLGPPHCALIEEYVGNETLGEVISDSISGGSNHDLLNALTLLAKFLAALHETTLTESAPEGPASVADSRELLHFASAAGEFNGLAAPLCGLHSMWAEEEFFRSSLPRCLIHDGLTPVNLLYSREQRDLTITDLETLHYDAPFADVGTVCAELKLSFVMLANDSYQAEPYIAFFLREYFASLTGTRLTYRQMTWMQAFFMGRRLLIIAQGEWLGAELKRWCLRETRNVWELIRQRDAFAMPPFQGAKAVFFDFYNTLVSVEDDEGDLGNFSAVRDYLATTWPSSGGQLPSAEELRGKYFSIIREMLKRSKEEYPDVDLEAVWAETLERFRIGPPGILIYEENRRRMREVLRIFRRSAVRWFEIFEGAREAISTLKAHNIRIGIISDAQTAYVESELKQLEILPLVDCFLVSARYGIRKPERSFFEWGLREVEAEPQEAVFVGDDMFRDIFGAKRVGMRTIYKPSEYGRSFYGTSAPDEVVTDLRLLPQLFGIPAKK
jgi:putative hydrolase of the HAD superfamily